MNAAKPMVEQQEWTARGSRTSKRTESSDGWTKLAQELKSRTYQPLPVRRVFIPKPDGKTQRPLGVPAIRDRTVEMAAVLVLEPIFEADLQPEQYAYRRDRSALDAVNRVHKLIYAGHQEIVDADLNSYLDPSTQCPLVHEISSVDHPLS
jgi:RNA-directed DNA polymerase